MSHPSPLRDELSLLPSTPFEDGSPCWTLHDPLANRFFELGQAEVAMLSVVGKIPQEQIPAYLAKQNVMVTADAVERFLRFLRQHHLLQARGVEAQQHLQEQAATQRRNRWKEWSRSYISMRIPLVRPDAFLTRTLPAVRWWFSPTTSRNIGYIALIGLLLMLPQSEGFFSTFTQFFNIEGIILYTLTLAGVKILHELGHAYTAKYYGCRVPVMGVAFMVFWPVLYTDTTDAWRLSSAKARLAIGWAGIKVEMAVAALALLGWCLLPDGIFRSMCFLLSTTTILMTLAVNLNPFMRFDGYYIFSDWLGVRNLQSRSSQLALWWIKEQLFALGDPPPEAVDKRLIAYAIGAYIYRFFLTLTIALLLYHMVFKLLGIVLLCLHIGLYILRPVWREITSLWQRRQDIHWNRHSRITAICTLLVLAVVILPLHGTVTAPALYQSSHHSIIYAPDDGYIASTHVQDGTIVHTGDKLVEMTSDTLALDIRSVRIELEKLRWELSTMGFAETLLDRRRIVESDLIAAQARLESLYRRSDSLLILAPIQGVVSDMLEGITHAWVRRNQPLMVIAHPAKKEVIAYVSEQDLPRIHPGAMARFYPRWRGNASVVRLRVSVIHPIGETSLDTPHLASVYGGEIPVRENEEKQLIPQQAIYKVVLLPDQNAESARNDEMQLSFPLIGYVQIEAERRSVIMRVLAAIAGSLRRESGM